MHEEGREDTYISLVYCVYYHSLHTTFTVASQSSSLVSICWLVEWGGRKGCSRRLPRLSDLGCTVRQVSGMSMSLVVAWHMKT